MAAPSPSDGALPRGIYTTYKRATTCFLSWLLRVHSDSGAVAVESDVKRPLELYDQIVQAIVATPASLSPTLLRLSRQALQACETAITLRSRVALFFGDASDDAHEHFLTRLQTWLQRLRTALVPTENTNAPRKTTTRRTAVTSTTMPDFSNYYDVLALPEDFFDNDDDAADGNDVPVGGEPTSNKQLPRPVAEVDRKRLVDAALDGDLNTELACLLMELEELSEAVYAAFLDIKKEKKTLVEATVITKVAIDSAAAVIASLQLRFPSVRDGNDLSTLIQNRLSLDRTARLVTSVQTAWQPSKDPSATQYQYVAGTVLVDIVGIVYVLRSFGLRANQELPTLGARYDEAATRRFVVPVWASLHPFFMHPLPQLLNTIGDLGNGKLGETRGSLVACFWKPFAAFRMTGVVSIHLVFICICWIRSIAALQGNRVLARTVGLSFMHLRDLQQRLEDSIGTDVADGYNPDLVDDLRNGLKLSEILSTESRVNPLLAGSIMLDYHIRYLSVGDATLLFGFVRPFCHIYSALRQCGFLDEIPFVEDTIEVYEASVFAVPRAAVTRGSFVQSFLASHRRLESSMKYRLHGNANLPRPGRPTSFLEKAEIMYLSRIMRLVYENDFSTLPSSSIRSWSGLFSSISNLCQEDLYHSRVLSRDLLNLSRTITDLFQPLCDVLGCRPSVERMVSRSLPRTLAVENALVFTLLPTLDKLTDQDLVHLDGEAVGLCRRAAAVLFRRFQQSGQIEQSYFTFPATPAWISIEFGPKVGAKAGKPKDQLHAEFCSLMKLLDGRVGPLRGKMLKEFKTRVVATPTVLRMASFTSELWSLLHHVAVGPAQDFLLVEWLIHMGALDYQLPFHRNPDLVKDAELENGLTADALPNALAVHCAAKKGYAKMVKLIVEAGYFRDLDTKTLHTKESLSQIAVQTGNRDLWKWLATHGARCTGVDALGKRVWECTSDSKWKALLLRVAKIQDPKRRADQLDKERVIAQLADVVYSTQGQTDAKSALGEMVTLELAKKKASTDLSSLFVAPLTPHTSDTTSTNQHDKTKKKKKKKQEKKKRATTQPSESSGVPRAAQLMTELFLADRPDSEGNQVQEVADALEELKNDAFDLPLDRERCASRVVNIYNHCVESLGNIFVLGIQFRGSLLTEWSERMAHITVLLLSHRFYVRPSNAVEIAANEGPERLPTMELFQLITPAANEHFEYFLVAMMCVSGFLRRVKSTQLANELLAQVEQCLLSATPRTGRFFRKMASRFIATFPTASPDLTRQLEWYAFNYGVDDEVTLRRLDRLYGCNHFAQLQVVGGLTNPAFPMCRYLIDQNMPRGHEAVYVDGFIIAGAETMQQLAVICRVVLDVAKQTEVELRFDDADCACTSIVIREFQFSATGIVRVAPSS